MHPDPFSYSTTFIHHAGRFFFISQNQSRTGKLIDSLTAQTSQLGASSSERARSEAAELWT
ncbi:unnamed protein product, partial [Amoebophrya sp. A120]|eukprot:GSA120T00026354001.1